MKHLVVGPGAMGFFAYLGALSKLKRQGQLDDLEEISGSSAGSLLSFLYCVSDGDPMKILDISLDIPIKSIMKPSIKTLLTDYGFVSSKKIRAILSKACEKLTGRDDITFSELYDRNPIKLHVAAYCVDLMKTVYFSVASTPTMSVLDALCASIAIPFLFSSIKLSDGWRYIDGGTEEDAPCGPFLGLTDVFVLKLGYNHLTEVKDFKSYAIHILYSTIKLRHTYGYQTVELRVTDGDMFDFGASNEGKLRMFLKGYDQV
jgi:hypothetical protein